MTSIDPRVQAVLDQMNASIPAPSDFDVGTFRSMVEDYPAEPVTTDLASVDNTTIPGPDGPLLVRIYRSSLEGDQPALLFIHGGGFIQRGLDSHDELCRRLSTGTGAVVIALDCRPAPEHPYPAAVDDTHAALQHIADEAYTLALNPSRLALAGISSGAAIIAATALRCRDMGGPSITLQILLTPMLRYREPTASRRTYGQGGFGITTALLDWYSDQYARGASANDPYCAPLRTQDLSGLPPAYIRTAEFDPLRDDGADYAHRLRLANVHAEHREAPGLFHGFHFFTDTLPSAQDALVADEAAIRRLISAPPNPRP
jgi:acetyl esterase